MINFAPPFSRGHLVCRYKRFLADIRLADGSIITVHCPNTGAMRGCSTPGSPVAYSVSDNEKRKYPCTLEMVQENGYWVGVNTVRANRVVAEAIRQKKICQWRDVLKVEPEVKISPRTRLDFRLQHENGSSTMVEVKSCSLAEGGVVMFPDAVTARGTKHLLELIKLAEKGQKTCIFYLALRMDADSFCPAAEIDPLYAKTFAKAINCGVQALVYQADISPEGINVVRELPIVL